MTRQSRAQRTALIVEVFKDAFAPLMRAETTIAYALTEQDVLDLARIGEKVVGRLDADHWILREN